MTANSLRRWRFVHRWTSLISTVNLLILCITGLVLIFSHEIEHLTEDEPAAVAEGTPRLSGQDLLDRAAALAPGQWIKMISFPADHPDEVFIRMGAPGVPSMRDGKWWSFNPYSGDGKPTTPPTQSFIGFLFKLHLDLFAGLPGQLFVGFIGILFVVATVSGVVVYPPSMRKLAFGDVRFSRTTRIVHTDLHNLFGMATLAWALVVGLTGAILSFSPLIIGAWQKTELAALVARHPGGDAPPVIRLDQAMTAARAAVPGKDVAFIAMPGTDYTSGRHFAVMMRGDSELTRRMLSVALVDGQTGRVAEVADTPWYIKALLLSGPFHFGNYGGLPLKILWALLTAAVTAVTVTGLVMWLKRPKASKAGLEKDKEHLVAEGQQA